MTAARVYLSRPSKLPKLRWNGPRAPDCWPNKPISICTWQKIGPFCHERWDGHGYPAGLSAEAIPAVARALSVVDSYDAMTMDRPYRKGLLHSEAMRRLRDNAGSQFDPAAVDAWETLHQVPDDFEYLPSW